MPDRVLHQSLEFRSLDEKARSATFVASTERAVPMGWGPPEVLRMSGARLQRYRRNPVLLDSHNRYGLESVIGRCDVTVSGATRELLATATYANTPRGELAWSLVRDGFVRAMSIGYSVNEKKVKRLREGEFDGEGEARITGPASIVREWELIEVSNVPVPADEDAVRRSFFESLKEEDMPPIDFSKAVDEGAATAPTTPAAPAASTTAPASPTATARASAELPAELAARTREALRKEILAVTPKGLEQVAERALLEGLDFEGARKMLLAEHAKRFKPVGTPEPKEPEAPAAAARAEAPLPEHITDDVLVRSFENLRG